MNENRDFSFHTTDTQELIGVFYTDSIIKLLIHSFDRIFSLKN